MEVYVIDGNELRAWGPFRDWDEAETFVQSDKYLQSWANIGNRRPKDHTLYSPAEYHGRWPL